MNRPKDKKYKQALKSVKDPFNKMDLWDEIEQKLEEKDRRVFPFWWLGGWGIVLFIGLVGGQYFTGQKEFNLGANALKEEPIALSQQAIKVEEEKAIILDLKENLISSDSDANWEKVKMEAAVNSGIKNRNENKTRGTINEENQMANTIVVPRLNPPIKEKSKAAIPRTNSLITTIKGKEKVKENRSAISIPSFLQRVKYSMIPNSSAPIVSSNVKELIVTPIRKRKLTFGLEVVGGTNDRQIKSLTLDSKTYAASRQSKEKGLYRTGVNVELAYKFKPSWELLSSLQWQRLVERFNAEKMEISTIEVPSDSATYTVEGGVSTYFPGMISRSIVSTRAVQQYNHTHKIGISLGLRYETQFCRIPVYAQGRLLYHPSFQTDGKMINSEEEIVDYISNDGLGIGQESRLEAQLGLGLSWQISKEVNLTTGIQWQQDLSLFNKSTDVRILDSGLGLAIGIRGFLF